MEKLCGTIIRIAIVVTLMVIIFSTAGVGISTTSPHAEQNMEHNCAFTADSIDSISKQGVADCSNLPLILQLLGRAIDLLESFNP